MKLKFIFIFVFSYLANAEFYFDKKSNEFRYRDDETSYRVNKRLLSRLQSKNTAIKDDLIKILSEKGYNCLKANNYILSKESLELCNLLNNFVSPRELIPNYSNGFCLSLAQEDIGIVNRFFSVEKIDDCYKFAEKRTVPNELYRMLNRELRTGQRFSRNEIERDNYEERYEQSFNSCVCKSYGEKSNCNIEIAKRYYKRFAMCSKVERCDEKQGNCSNLDINSGLDISVIRDEKKRLKAEYLKKTLTFKGKKEYNDIIEKYSIENIDVFSANSKNHFAILEEFLKEGYEKKFEEEFEKYTSSRGCKADFVKFIESFDQSYFERTQKNLVEDLYKKLEGEIKSGDRNYNKQVMLKFLALYDDGGDESIALLRLAPRLQWGKLWMSTVTKEDEKYIDELLKYADSKDVEEALNTLRGMVNPKSWEGGNSLIPELKSAGVMNEFIGNYRNDVLKKLVEKMKKEDKAAGSTAALVAGAVVVASQSVRVTANKVYEKFKNSSDLNELAEARMALKVKRYTEAVSVGAAAGATGISIAISAGGGILLSFSELALTAYSNELASTLIQEKKLEERAEAIKEELARVEQRLRDSLERQVEQQSDPNTIYDDIFAVPGKTMVALTN